MATSIEENQPKQRKVSHNAIAQMAGRVVYLASRVALPPFILHHITPEEYGIWSTCFLIISYVGIGAFGVSNVYIRFVAEYVATNRKNEIGRLIATGLSLTLSFSVVIFTLLWLLMPWINDWFKVPLELQATASFLILGTVATMLMDMTFGVFAYVLIGLHRIIEQTIVWILTVLLESILIVVFLMLGYGVEGMFWAFVIRYVIATIVYMLYAYKFLPGLRIRLTGPGKSPVKLFMNYGGIIQLSAVVAVFMSSVERLIAGTLNGVVALGILDISQKFPMMCSAVFSSASNSILVGLTHLHTMNKVDETIQLYRRSVRYISLLNGCAMGFMAAYAAPIIVAWIGTNPTYSDAWQFMVLATIGFHINALTGPANIYCQAINRPGLVISQFQLPQLTFLGLALAYFYSIDDLSLLSVVISAAMARILSSLMFIAFVNHRMGFSQWRYFRIVLLPGLMPYTVGYAMALITQTWLDRAGTARIPLLLTLSGTALCYGLLVIAVLSLMLDQDERSQIIKALKRPKLAS